MGKIMLDIFLTLCVFLLPGVFGVDTDAVSVMEGGSVTLNTDVEINHKDRIKWFLKDTRIAQIIGNISNCTDVQCNEGNERFRDRLKLDHQTGSLTITNTRPEDSGLYELQITSNTDRLRIFNVTISGAGVFVSVMEGNSVTLNTGVTTNQQEKMKWYFNDIRIAQINGDQSFICTDVQCNEGTERFRDRLKLDHLTGSLTITNTRNTDSGVYHLQINSRNSEKIFNLDVHGASAGELDEVKKTVKEGESVTLDPGVIKHTIDVMMWYFNDIFIVEIAGDPSKTFTDVQREHGDERFRDRLKANQAGSLTITNIRTTDTGLYKLHINRSSSSFSIRRIRIFSVNVTASGPSSAAVAGIVFLVLVVVTAAAAAFIYYCKRKAIIECTRTAANHNNEINSNFTLLAGQRDRFGISGFQDFTSSSILPWGPDANQSGYSKEPPAL